MIKNKAVSKPDDDDSDNFNEIIEQDYELLKFFSA